MEGKFRHYQGSTHRSVRALVRESLVIIITGFMTYLARRQAMQNWTIYFITMPKRLKLKRKIF